MRECLQDKAPSDNGIDTFGAPFTTYY